MKKFRFIAAIVLLLMLAASCRTEKVKFENTNGIWLWGVHMKEAPLQEYAEKGIGHIFLNEAAFDRWGENEVYAFIDECEKYGLTVHIWFQAFYFDGKWVSPIDDEKRAIKQDFYDMVIARAKGYVEKGVDGIHLDYIRYGGTAHKHDWPECGATWSVTEFCRQLNVALKEVNPDVILSAALMPEIDSEYYYGQNPEQMGQYLDVLIPMVYRYGYAGEDKSLEWVIEVSNWFEEKSGPADVWVGIQTYKVNMTPEASGQFSDGGHIIPLTAEELLSDCKDILKTNCTGIVYFRHGIGEYPDISDLWKK